MRGCELLQTTMIRANALCAYVGEWTESGAFWRQQTPEEYDDVVVVTLCRELWDSRSDPSSYAPWVVL